MSDQDDSSDLVRLRQTLFWLLVIAVVATAMYGILWLFVPSIYLLFLSATSGGAFVLFLAAHRLVARGQMNAAVYLASLTIVLATLVSGVITPDLLPVLALLPIMSMALLVPYLDRRMLTVFSVGTVLQMVALALLTQYVRLFEPLPPALTRLLLIFLLPLATVFILLMLWQSYARQQMALQQSRQANVELKALQAGLETQVAERTSELRGALAALEAQAAEQARVNAELAQQREAIRELSVPVLPVAAQTLVMPLIGALDTRRLQELQERALAAVEERRARRLILDVTGVPVVDSQVAQGLIRVVQAAALLGTRAILVGIRPEVAQTLVGLGIDLAGVRTFASLEAVLTDAGAAATRI